VRLGQLTAWARWVRDDVRVQGAAWLAATLSVLGPANSWARWPGLLNLQMIWSPAMEDMQLRIGWAVATLMTLGWATGRLQLVFTFEQRAMLFPPWSVLVFVRLRPREGDVVFFDGCDGRSYVRRVQEVVKDVPLNAASMSPRDPHLRHLSRHSSPPVAIRLRTRGDLADAPDDRLLYSADGTKSCLDLESVRGTLAAGPFTIQAMLGLVVIASAVSPMATLAFIATNQPILTAWLSVLLHFCVILLVHAPA